MTDQVSASETIAAPAEDIYDLVADLPRMGEWSPENAGGKWIRGSSGPTVGAKFKGTNKNGWHRWNTIVTVTTAERGKRFAFHVSYGPFDIADWSYDFTPTDSGTLVTETWIDRRPAALSFMGKPISGVGTAGRPEHNRRGMQRTLAELKRAAESSLRPA